MAASVPVVERADDADPPRIRRPHREGDAVDLLDAARMGAEPVIGLGMAALREEVGVELAEHRGECIGIVALAFALLPTDAEPVGKGLGRRRQGPGEEPRIVNALERERDAAVPRRDDLDFARIGHEGADRDAAVARPVHAEHGEGIGLVAGDGRRDRGLTRSLQTGHR